jgi:hypothetical protein
VEVSPDPKQREEMHALRGLKDSAIYEGLDGVAYQRKTRDEWDDRCSVRGQMACQTPECFL